MSMLFKALVMVYCFLCRFFFEFGSVVMAWYLFPRFWAVFVTIAFVIWQILGFHVVAWLKENKS